MTNVIVGNEFVPPAELLTRDVRILVGESVFEDATVTIRDEQMYVEFASDDLDDLAIPLTALRPNR